MQHVLSRESTIISDVGETLSSLRKTASFYGRISVETARRFLLYYFQLDNQRAPKLLMRANVRQKVEFLCISLSRHDTLVSHYIADDSRTIHHLNFYLYPHKSRPEHWADCGLSQNEESPLPHPLFSKLNQYAAAYLFCSG